MDILKGGKSPSSEPLLPVDAREKTASGSHSTPDNQQTKKMACARRLFLVSSLCLLVLLGFAAAGSALRVPCHKGHQSSPHASADSSKFSDLLKSASPSSLNDLLHQYFPEKFQKGVWPSEHEAVEAVHEEDAALATSIVRLAKRADGDNSTATTNPEPTDNSSSDPPVDPTTTPDIPSSSTVNQPTTTPDEPSSTSKPEPTTPESSTNSPSPPGTSSLSETTLLPTTSSFPETSSTSGPSSSFSETLPSSSIAGNTTLTTHSSTLQETSTDKPTTAAPTTTSPPRTSKEIVETRTTTSNGNVVTITSTRYVPPDSEETGGAEPTNKSPSLQNAGSRVGGGAAALMAGVVGVVAAMVL